VWLLTGDKQETAINVGLSSRLINKDMHIYILDAADSVATGEQIRSFNADASDAKHVSCYSALLCGALFETRIHFIFLHIYISVFCRSSGLWMRPRNQRCHSHPRAK
jgi:magnesium-transporting ATPase (P-type)